jgi:hypothetical protein
VEPLADQVDDVAQRLRQIVRAADDLGDVRQERDAVLNEGPQTRPRGAPAASAARRSDPSRRW